VAITRTLHFSSALLGNQWADNVQLCVDANGIIEKVKVDIAPSKKDICYEGTAIPGMPNVHSHAFQRAMAGLAESWSPDGDSFWGWRNVMYRFLENINPDDAFNIARQLYSEMLTAGYTSVGEFHYLHHAHDGTPYDNPSEMSEAIIAAVKEVGIALTHLPVLYQTKGFDEESVNEDQRRFYHSNEDFLKLLDRLSGLCGREGDDIQLGMAFHSLRAVPMDNLRHITAEFRSRFGEAPIHIHIAEQDAELVNCLLHRDRRPIQYLLETGMVDKNWTFIHATHIDENELKEMVRVGAIAGLCPTTEANLGDGLFPIELYLGQKTGFGGVMAIGSDSHISVDAAEEIRLLEYCARLSNKMRGRLGDENCSPVGTNLWKRAALGGAQSLGRKTGFLQIGQKADIVVLDNDTAITTGRKHDNLLNSFIFSNQNGAANRPIKHVLVSGHEANIHQPQDNDNTIYQAYKKTMAKLMEKA
jgi:formimidoylglutamate deiminase